MRVRSGAAVSMAVAILLSLTLAIPASARQLIEYQGQTSARSLPPRERVCGEEG